jgi:hypothetical protein
MIGNDVVEKLKGHLLSRKDISFAFLFGSQVPGKTFRESDVDIAIHFRERYSFETVKLLWSELEGIIRKDVDLLVLNTAPPLIGYTAIRGKALAINDQPAFLEYMLRISQEAEDFREFLLDMWKLRENLRARSSNK